MKYPKILAQIEASWWAITPEALQGIWDIASQEFEPGSMEIYLKFHQNSMDERLAISSSLGIPVFESGLSFKKESTGIVRIDGPIIPRADALSSSSGLVGIDQILGDFNAFEDDPQVEKIVLLWDSPGGSTTGITEMESAVANSKKPTISYVYGRAASAAYFIGSAAKEIVASPMSMVGSLGTVAVYRISNDSNKIEIVSAQSPFKRPDMTTKEGRSNIQQVVNELTDVFIGTVAKNRGVTTAKVLSDFGKGGVLAAERAVSVGMVDSIATLESVLNSSVSAGQTGSTVAISIPATAGQQEGKVDKTLQDFLRENPAAAAEYDIAIKAAREDGKVQGVTEGKAEGAKEVNARVSGAMKFVTSEAYGEAINKLAMRVVNGEVAMDALESAATSFDATKEHFASLAATSGGNGDGLTIPPSDPKAVDLAKELAEDNQARAEVGLPPLKMEV